MKYVSAQDATQILRDVFNKPGGSFRVTFDAASNTVIVSGDPNTLKDVRKLLENVLDKNPGAGGDPLGGGPAPGAGGGPPSGAVPGSPVGGEGAPAAQPVTVITLRHAPAMDTSDLIDRVFRGRLSVTPDPRTNSLIIRADKATLVEVESLLLKLDVDTPAPPVRKADK